MYVSICMYVCMHVYVMDCTSGTAHWKCHSLRGSPFTLRRAAPPRLRVLDCGLDYSYHCLGVVLGVRALRLGARMDAYSCVLLQVVATCAASAVLALTVLFGYSTCDKRSSGQESRKTCTNVIRIEHWPIWQRFANLWSSCKMQQDLTNLKAMTSVSNIMTKMTSFFLLNPFAKFDQTSSTCCFAQIYNTLQSLGTLVNRWHNWTQLSKSYNFFGLLGKC